MGLRRVRRVNRRLLADGQSSQIGGLNLSADASQLAPNQVRQAANARLTIFGGMQKRGGTQNLHATALEAGAIIRSIFAWIKDDGTQQLLAVSNGNLHTGTYGAPMTWVTVTSTTSLSTSVYPSFAAFRNSTTQCVYAADGGRLLSWDGTTFSRSTTSINVSQVWVYNQRLYGIGGSDAILLASGLNNGDDLGDTARNGVQVPIRTFGESAIVNGTALGVSNLIFHRGGISRWTGVTQDDIAISSGTLGISPDTGTIVARSIVSTEAETYFLSDRGFYAVNAYGLRRISTTLDPAILALFTTNGANLCAAHNKAYREVVWYLPDIGIYAYNYQANAWTGPWNGGYINPITHSMCYALNSSSQPIVLVGTANGFVKQMDFPNIMVDNALSDGSGGTAYTYAVQLRRQFFGNPASVKALRWLYVLAQLNGSANMAVAWATATQGGSQVLTPLSGAIWDAAGLNWDSFIWGQGDSSEYRVPASGRGNYVDLTVTDNSTNALPLLSGVRSEAFDYGEQHEYA